MTTTTSREAFKQSLTAAHQAARCEAYPHGRWILTDGDGLGHARIVVGSGKLSREEARSKAAAWCAAEGVKTDEWFLVDPDGYRSAVTTVASDFLHAASLAEHPITKRAYFAAARAAERVERAGGTEHEQTRWGHRLYRSRMRSHLERGHQ